MYYILVKFSNSFMLEETETVKPFSYENQVIVLLLNFRTTVDDVYKAFSQYGKILDMHMVVNDNYESKGFAFINYEDRQSGQNAIQRMNGQRFDGRVIKVNWANEKDREQIKKTFPKKPGKDSNVKSMVEQDLLKLTRSHRS